MLNVDSLNKGVVIDHICAGKAMDIYKYLNLDRLDCSVAIIKNAKSRKMGRKDIIKIDDNIDINLDVLGFMDPNITVNIINEGGLIEKKKLSLPTQVTNVIKCKNPRCITSIEQGLNHYFKLSDAENGVYRCIYCEQEFQNK
ncbi:MAG: aspartate carbamoyltransferase regulatory subunit [Hydrogenoanaerobacterium sp.]